MAGERGRGRSRDARRPGEGGAGPADERRGLGGPRKGLRRRRPARARRHAWRRALRLGHGGSWVWYYLSIAHGELDEPAPALEAARESVERAPDNPCALVNLGRKLLRNGKPHEAIRHLEEAARRDPGSAVPTAVLGFALYRVGEFARAAECLEDSLRNEPDDPFLWAVLGASLDEGGRHEGALHALETAVFAKPDHGWAWGRLGKVLRSLGRHEEAVRAYEKSVEHGFSPPVLWADLGDSAAELRDVPRLRRACRELGRVDAEMAKALRRKLRSLTAKARTTAPPPPAAS